MAQLSMADIKSALKPSDQDDQNYWKEQCEIHYPHKIDALSTRFKSYAELFHVATLLDFKAIDRESALYIISAKADNVDYLKTTLANKSKEEINVITEKFKSVIDAQGKSALAWCLEKEYVNWGTYAMQQTKYAGVIPKMLPTLLENALQVPGLTRDQKARMITKINMATSNLATKPEMTFLEAFGTHKQRAKTETVSEIVEATDLVRVRKWFNTLKKDKTNSIISAINKAIENNKIEFLRHLITLTTITDYDSNDRETCFLVKMLRENRSDIYALFLKNYPDFYIGQVIYEYFKFDKNKKKKYGKKQSRSVIETILGFRNGALFLEHLLAEAPVLANTNITLRSPHWKEQKVTPLAYAIIGQQIDHVVVLLKYKADPALPDYVPVSCLCAFTENQIMLDYLLTKTDPIKLLNATWDKLSVYEHAASAQRDKVKGKNIFVSLHQAYQKIMQGNDDAAKQMLTPITLSDIVKILANANNALITEYIIQTYPHLLVKSEALTAAISEHIEIIVKSERAKTKNQFLNLATLLPDVHATLLDVLRTNAYVHLKEAVQHGNIKLIRIAKDLFADEQFAEITQPLHLFPAAIVTGSSEMAELLIEYKVDATLTEADVKYIKKGWQKQKPGIEGRMLLRKYHKPEVKSNVVVAETDPESTPVTPKSTIDFDSWEAFIRCAFGGVPISIVRQSDRLRVVIPEQFNGYEKAGSKDTHSAHLDAKSMSGVVNRVRNALKGKTNEASIGTLIKIDQKNPAHFVIVPGCDHIDLSHNLNHQIFEYLTTTHPVKKSMVVAPVAQFSLFHAALKRAAARKNEKYEISKGVRYEQLYLNAIDRLLNQFFPDFTLSKYQLSVSASASDRYCLTYNLAETDLVTATDKGDVVYYSLHAVLKALATALNACFGDEHESATNKPAISQQQDHLHSLTLDASRIGVDKLETNTYLITTHVVLPTPKRVTADFSANIRLPEVMSPQEKGEIHPKLFRQDQYSELLQTIAKVPEAQKALIAEDYRLFSEVTQQDHFTKLPEWMAAITFTVIIHMLESIIRTTAIDPIHNAFNIIRNLFRHLFDKLDPDKFNSVCEPIIKVIAETSYAAPLADNALAHYYNATVFKQHIADFEKYIGVARDYLTDEQIKLEIKPARLENDVPHWVVQIDDLFQSDVTYKKEGIAALLCFIGESFEMNEDVASPFKFLCKAAYCQIGHHIGKPYAQLCHEIFTQFEIYATHPEWQTIKNEMRAEVQNDTSPCWRHTF